MTKIILFLLVVAAILFGGKFGLEYYYGKKIDELIDQASAVADIKYQNVRIGTDGSISINNLIIEPHTPQTLVRIDAITLFSSDILLPVNLTTFIKRAELPDELGVRIEDIEYDPNVMANINQQNSCRHIETTLHASNAGINRLNANMELSINMTANNAVINVSSSDQTADMHTSTVLDSNILTARQSGSSVQSIEEASIRYKLNKSIAEDIIQTCAQKLGISKEVYLETVVGSPFFLQSTGAYYGSEASQAMKEFVQGDKWLTIDIKPNPQLERFDNLGFYKTKDIVRLLGLKLTLDAKDVPLNIFDLPKPIATNVTNEDQQENLTDEEKAAMELAEAKEKISAEVSPEEQRRIELKLADAAASRTENYSYKTTSVNSLKRYLNHSVILKRGADKKQIAGELIAVNGDVFTVETSQYGGKVILNVSLSDIVEAQTYR